MKRYPQFPSTTLSSTGVNFQVALDSQVTQKRQTQSRQAQRQQARTHCALGALHTRQAEYAKAVCHFRLALQLDPEEDVAALCLGRLLHRLGDAKGAIAAYHTALERVPGSAEAHYALGLLCEQAGDERSAIKHYRKAIFTDRSYTNAYRRLGSVLTRLQATDVALAVYGQAIENGAADAELYNNLGQAYFVKGDTASEMDAYQQALTLDAGSAIAHQSLGRLYQRHQATHQAIYHFQQACELAPTQLTLLSDYVWALMRQGLWREVLSCFRRACVDEFEFVFAYCQRTVNLPEGDLLFRLQRMCSEFLLDLYSVDGRIGEAPTEDRQLKLRLAQVFECAGDLARAGKAFDYAEQCYRRALSLNPDGRFLYALVGECVRMRSPQAAAAVFQAGLLRGQIAEDIDAISLSDNVDETLKQGLAETLADCSDGFVVGEAERSAVPSTNPTNNDVYSVAGIYRDARDWLADNNLAEPRDALEAPVAIAHIAKLESSPNPGCGGLTCQKCMTELVRQFSPIQVSKRAFCCTDGLSDGGLSDADNATDKVDAFETFAITIPNGRLWVAPQKSAWDVCGEIAVFSSDGFLLGNLSRYYPWYLPGCDRHDVINHPVLRKENALPSVKHLAGRVAVLSGLSAHVYYHWLFDVLPRVGILQEALQAEGRSLADIDYFVVNSVQKSFQRETLMALGVPIDKVVESDRMPHIQAEQLLVPSFAGHLDWVPPRSLKFLRAALLINQQESDRQETDRQETDGLRKREGRRLYVTRSRANYRHVLNEDAVIDSLNSFGFEQIALETLTVAQQVQLFSEAAMIVGAHGSGLSNLAFCTVGTTVVEFFSPGYLRTDYWMISEALGLHHYYLMGEKFAFSPLRQLMYPSGLTEDILVDVEALKRLMQRLSSVP